MEGTPLGNGDLDEVERGIPDVEVRIAQNACPPADSGVPASSGPTDENGHYYYFAPVGMYCVTIIPEDLGNDLILLPGRFTHPIHESMPIGTAYKEVTIESDGQIVAGVDFGWEYTEDETPGGIGGIAWLDEDADGVMNENRWGIYDLDISLYQGSCGDGEFPPGDSLGHRYTDRYGAYGILGSDPHSYGFDEVPPGEYCFRLSRAAGSFPWELDGSPLGDSYWTFPNRQDVDPSIWPKCELTLNPGEVRMDVNIGLHTMPFVIPDSSVNCRSAPYLSSPVDDYLNADRHYWLKGRVGDNSWWFVNGRECWVAESVVAFYGDPNDLPVYPWPPTPVPQATDTPEPGDMYPPLVEISHSPSSPTISDSVTFTAIASDNVGVKKISIWVKVSMVWSQYPIKTCNNTTSCTYIGGPFDEGEVEYYAEAVDTSGNEGQSSVHGFNVTDPYQ